MPEEAGARTYPRRKLLSLFGTAAAGLWPGTHRLFAAASVQAPQRQGQPDPATLRPAPRMASIYPIGQRSVMERSLSRAGAVGDGKTIDTAAIQEAVAEVERNTRFETHGSKSPFAGPGELVWPQGLFLVDDTIRITRSLKLRGEGQAEYSSGARIQQERSGCDLFRVEPIAQGCSIGLENLSLRANGGGASGGALLRITKAAGQCNTIRISQSVFATPQSHAIVIERGDDITICRCLFDVSSTDAIRLGDDAGDVSNIRISENYFFSILGECIQAIQTNGLVVEGNTVFAERSTRLFLRSGSPRTRSRNSVVRGNTFRNVGVVADIMNSDGLVIDTNSGDELGGPGVGAVIRCWERVTGLIVTNNRLQLQAADSIYNDAGARVDQAVVANNSFSTRAGRGPGLAATATSGRVDVNSVSGFARNGIGHRWRTTDRAVLPASLSAGQTRQVTLAATGSRPGDDVTATPTRALPDSVSVTARAEQDAVRISYRNQTQMQLAVPAHDLWMTITRA